MFASLRQLKEATFSRGLFNHCDQGLFVALDRVDLLKIKSFGSASLDCVKRAENQSFHLQLVDVVQLFFKPYREKTNKKNTSAVRECENVMPVKSFTNGKRQENVCV